LIGSGLTAVYFLLMVNRVFFGRLTPELAKLPKVLWRERFPAMILALLIFVLGIQPHWLTLWSEPQAAVLLTGQSEAVAETLPLIEKINS
jgi:NAD(P)H-quinone oxidoreductase subunit 4